MMNHTTPEAWGEVEAPSNVAIVLTGLALFFLIPIVLVVAVTSGMWASVRRAWRP